MDLKGINIPGLVDFLNKQKTGGGGNYWKPKDGDNIIRIIPPNPEINPDIAANQLFFTESSSHSIEGQVYFCPEALVSQKCPICEARRKIYGGAKRAGRDVTVQEKSLADSFGTKRRYIANIVVRGEEDKGVQVYDFGIKVLEKLVKIMSDPGYGDITDLVNGRDFVLSKKSRRGPDGKEWPDYDSSLPKSMASPAGTNEQISKWMGTQFDLKKMVIPRILPYEKLFELAFSITPEQARKVAPETHDKTMTDLAASINDSPFGNASATVLPGGTTEPAAATTVTKGYTSEATPAPAAAPAAAPATTPSFQTMTTDDLLKEIQRRQNG